MEESIVSLSQSRFEGTGEIKPYKIHVRICLHGIVPTVSQYILTDNSRSHPNT